jgi:hypothetical protein
MGECARCKKSFDDDQLRKPSRVLRLILLPKLWVLAEEANALYCYRCRRNVNAALFFIAFMIVFVVFVKVLRL